MEPTTPPLHRDVIWQIATHFLPRPALRLRLINKAWAQCVAELYPPGLYEHLSLIRQAARAGGLTRAPPCIVIASSISAIAIYHQDTCRETHYEFDRFGELVGCAGKRHHNIAHLPCSAPGQIPDHDIPDLDSRIADYETTDLSSGPMIAISTRSRHNCNIYEVACVPDFRRYYRERMQLYFSSSGFLYKARAPADLQTFTSRLLERLATHHLPWLKDEAFKGPVKELIEICESVRAKAGLCALAKI